MNQYSAAPEYTTRLPKLGIWVDQQYSSCVLFELVPFSLLQLDDADGIENAKQSFVEIKKVTPVLSQKSRVISVDRAGNGESFQRNRGKHFLVISASCVTHFYNYCSNGYTCRSVIYFTCVREIM